jgi:hypothetical protein
MNEQEKDFINGMFACERGEECPDGASDDFAAGYGKQYELEQVEGHKSER